MSYIKVAGATLNQTPIDWSNNRKNIVSAIEMAKEQEVSLLCLPELCITGYGCEDAFYCEGLRQNAQESLLQILPHSKGIAVALGLPMSYQNRIFNTACLLIDGKIIGFVAKQFLAGNGIYYEPRWFTPWQAGFHTSADVGGEKFPLGDIYFDIDGIKVGFEICEDAWSADRVGRRLARAGVDIILNPSASHFAFEKLATRMRYILEGSRAFGVAYVYTNLLGNDSGRVIFDGGSIIAGAGRLLACSKRLTFDDVLLSTAVIDLAETRMAQAQSSERHVIFDEPASRCIHTSFKLPHTLPQKKEIGISWESSPHLKEEEFTRVLALGLFDYMRKSHSKGFVISLSGGADSAAVACCCYLMIHLAVEQIGIAAFKEKLTYFSFIQNCESTADFAKKIITTAYQATENSGELTRSAAAGLAKALHTHHLELSVDSIFKSYIGIISEGLGRSLNWETDDLALQNIQSRVRAPSVWILANIQGALLLSTSNRSEAAVGYATMDGDTSGGLNPIAGIDKAFLRKWLVWLEQSGVGGVLRFSALQAVNSQQPTAELRPKKHRQTDEDDLMPYEILEAIEEAAIGNKKMPLDCYLLLKTTYKQYRAEQLKGWVMKFFKLWCRNQWKRERYAPCFHLDDKNLDPKTWCRFPILSGGFAKELEELRLVKE